MAVKFFGQFLVEKGVVSREILLQAIELQESVNLSFGATSLAMGILTEADIERVHNAQRIEDLRFGDMAVKLGLLTSEQMMQVLARQKNTHLYIGEALVKVGSFQADELPKYLEEFKADQAQYATDTVVIPTGVSEPKIWEMVADLSYKMLTRVALLVFRPEPCFVADRVPAMDVYATMDFTGDISGRYFMGVTAATQKKIAKAILKEPNVDNEPKEILDDTVMEFVNVALGNIAAKAAQSGKSMEIAPPEIMEAPDGIQVPDGHKALCFPVCLSDGDRIELAVFIQQ
ncbi:chemotaxis protein CheX [Geobacter grbiciae]|uniref:chemotaxis protein CheX n=1 Tax=Geobacter grbiciae TaxID=155042 RepID=UPI001C00EE46|nr:chemotaxis protein CheX [Geobacter grbiciae]MBT1075873.1 chemotaxis protein CheX [Geobacter grbiciae]